MTANRPSILITDDNSEFRETVREVLRPLGYRTILAGDGEEAFHIVRHEPVHVLLLDMHMPRLTGLETLRRVKQFKALLPCILISAKLDDAIREEAEEAQAFSVLPKPISRLDLTRNIHEALERTYGWS